MCGSTSIPGVHAEHDEPIASVRGVHRVPNERNRDTSSAKEQLEYRLAAAGSLAEPAPPVAHLLIQLEPHCRASSAQNQ